MKAMKRMFLGSIILLVAILCAVWDARTGSLLAGASIILAATGLVIFFTGFFC